MARGGLFAAAVFTDAGVYSTSLPRPSREEALAAVGGDGLPVVGGSWHTRVLEAVMAAYNGTLSENPPAEWFDFSGLTDNQRRVLLTLLQVPRGTTVTYGELARMAGLPGAARFVGNVMAANRYAPLIPCHRVVAVRGLGGYGLGLATKQMLLRRELVIAD